MTSHDFLREIDRIFQIAFTQKIVRMILRAAWMAGAIYLGFWGTNRLWGWFPNQSIWVFGALSAAILVIGSVILVRKPGKQFVWRLDQGYSLNEQVYTLYEVLRFGEPGMEKSPLIQDLLNSQNIARLREVRRELVDKGWGLKQEFESTIMVLVLLMIVYLTSVSSITQLQTGGMLNVLPALGSELTADQVFTSGIPGYQGPAEGLGDGIGATGEIGLMSSFDLNPLEWLQVSALIKKLGEGLKAEAATHELGRALYQENYKEAANQFGNLAENSDTLSAGVRGQIADQFLGTAVALQDIQQTEISSYFQEASAALYSGSKQRVYEELDDLADLMELFSKFQAREMRADMNTDLGASQSLQLDPFQNNLLVIEEVEDLTEYVSSPSNGEIDGEGTLNESVDFIMPFDQSVIEGLWQQFQFSLEDSDVVSSYFSPR